MPALCEVTSRDSCDTEDTGVLVPDLLHRNVQVGLQAAAQVTVRESPSTNEVAVVAGVSDRDWGASEGDEEQEDEK